MPLPRVGLFLMISMISMILNDLNWFDGSLKLIKTHYVFVPSNTETVWWTHLSDSLRSSDTGLFYDSTKQTQDCFRVAPNKHLTVLETHLADSLRSSQTCQARSARHNLIRRGVPAGCPALGGGPICPPGEVNTRVCTWEDNDSCGVRTRALADWRLEPAP